jgi:hypothetical protein
MCIEPPLPRRPPGQLGHDQLGVDPVSKHMAMIAVAGDDAVMALVERRLQAHGDRFLPDIEMAKTADQPKPIKLPRLFLEPADEHHLLVELQQFRL